MTRRRGTAVATALLLAALATAGCGLGPGPDVGSVRLTVTREYGRVPVLRRSLEARESDTVLRLLERAAAVGTRYGGRYVSSIDGVSEGQRGGDPYDWFFYVDGTEAPIGAAAYGLHGGERVWWDYRDWSATDHVPAVVGSWPAPFAGGGRPRPVLLECDGGGGACATARAALERVGARIAAGAREGAPRMLVGPWRRLREDAAAAAIEAGPGQSGVFARFARGREGWELEGLDQAGHAAGKLGAAAGLVAATSRYGGPPVWVVTGGTTAAVRAAAGALDGPDLRDHYAVAIAAGKETALPVEGR